MKRILDTEPSTWYIRRIDESTTAQNFKGEKIVYNHYYRIYRADDTQIKYCKFQKIDKLANILGMSVEDMPVISE